MCTHNIVSGIITWFYVCTQHHLWNHDLILCVHTTSSLEWWPDFMCTHNFISGIMTWFYVCTQHHAQHHLWNHNMISWVRTTSSLESWPDFMCIQKIIAGIITRLLINVASQESFIKAWAVAPNPSSAAISLYWFEEGLFQKSTKKTVHNVRYYTRSDLQRCFCAKVYSLSWTSWLFAVRARYAITDTILYNTSQLERIPFN